MSTKATKSSRMAARALAGSNLLAREARLASETAALAKDAVSAAVAALCAADRMGAGGDAGRAQGISEMERITAEVRKATEQAVEQAKEAMVAEDKGDIVSATWAAEMSLKAARQVNSLAAEASVLMGKRRQMASGAEVELPQVSASPKREDAQRGGRDTGLAAAIGRASRYLVTYDAAIIATFAREDDAFLLESELADLDVAHATKHAKCEVLDRVSGHRLGGYLIAGGEMVLFVRDSEYASRYGRKRR